MTTDHRSARRRAWRRLPVHVALGGIVTGIGLGIAIERPAAAAPLAGTNQTPTAANDAAFKTGLDQYTRGNPTGAIATWETLLGTMGEAAGFKVLYNLGLAYQQIGDVTKAIERYRAFIGQVEQKPYVEPDLAARANDARTRMTQLEASHGQVHVRPPKSGPIVLTRVNGGEPRPAGYTLWLAPGTHSVEIHVGTDHPQTISLDVTKGGSVDVETTPPPLPVPSRRDAPPSAVVASPAATSAESRPLSKSWFWIGAGATVASFALPVGLNLVASGKADDARALGPGHTGYADASSAYDDARTFYYASFVLPAALAVVTTVLWFASERPAPRSTVSGGR